MLYRIFYIVNMSNTDRITARELRKSNLIAVLHTLDSEDDINKITDYFSYRHFYVIYTSFWKLDADRDMQITRTELARYDRDGLSLKAVDREILCAMLRKAQKAWTLEAMI